MKAEPEKSSFWFHTVFILVKNRAYITHSANNQQQFGWSCDWEWRFDNVEISF